MELSALFKAVLDADTMPVVICDPDHTIVYMNPCAAERYAKHGGAELVGSSLLDCHNERSNELIKKAVEWFSRSTDNNRVYTFYNPKEDKDVYMVALRDDCGRLIGYYEKHESRVHETAEKYEMK